MAIKKTTKGEGKLEVLRGESAEVLNKHFAKTGKYALSEFSEDEMNEFRSELADVESDPVETRGDVAGGDDE